MTHTPHKHHYLRNTLDNLMPKPPLHSSKVAARNKLMQDIIRQLICQELSRDTSFLNVPIESYCDKLMQQAEFALSFKQNVCQGFVAYYCNDKKTRVAYITLIMVTPEWRNKGIGKALIHFVIERARTLEFRYLDLEVTKHNKAAIALYTRLGFAKVEERKEKWLMQYLL